MMSETYGQLVSRLRDARDWTQQELADRSGVPKRTIQEVESGRVKKPQRATRLAINEALEIEGDIVRERSERPRDVEAITDIIAAYLMTMEPLERIEWLRDVIPSDKS